MHRPELSWKRNRRSVRRSSNSRKNLPSVTGAGSVRRSPNTPLATPSHAEEIRDLFPALLMMEQIAPDSDAEASFLAGSSLRKQLVEHPEQLGDYRILREIGRGGMGIVYEAEQVSLGRHVALKVLPQLLQPDLKQRQRFEREARSAARLHHTNIVPVFGVGEEGGLHYYVMQYIQGLGLDAVLDELRRLRPETRPSCSTVDGRTAAGHESRPTGRGGGAVPLDGGVSASGRGCRAGLGSGGGRRTDPRRGHVPQG